MEDKLEDKCIKCKCRTCDLDECVWYLCNKSRPVNNSCFTDDCSHYYNEQDAIDEGLLDGYGE